LRPWVSAPDDLGDCGVASDGTPQNCLRQLQSGHNASIGTRVTSAANETFRVSVKSRITVAVIANETVVHEVPTTPVVPQTHRLSQETILPEVPTAVTLPDSWMVTTLGTSERTDRAGIAD
jgi:hypothetical protein